MDESKEERVSLHEYYPKYSSCTYYLLPAIQLTHSLTQADTLKKLGFIGCFLIDKTEGNREVYENGVLLIFNPSISFLENNWDKFIYAMSTYKNLSDIIRYDEYVYGFWFAIIPEFGNVKTLFKKGQFSKFPQKLIVYLHDKRKKICLKDKDYQKALEIRLGLNEGQLDDAELDEIPSPDSYTFIYVKEE